MQIDVVFRVAADFEQYVTVLPYIEKDGAADQVYQNLQKKEYTENENGRRHL